MEDLQQQVAKLQEAMKNRDIREAQRELDSCSKVVGENTACWGEAKNLSTGTHEREGKC